MQTGVGRVQVAGSVTRKASQDAAGDGRMESEGDEVVKWMNRLAWLFLLLNLITLPTALIILLTGRE